MKDNEVRHISLTKVNGTFKIMGVSCYVIWQNINITIITKLVTDKESNNKIEKVKQLLNMNSNYLRVKVYCSTSVLHRAKVPYWVKKYLRVIHSFGEELSNNYFVIKKSTDMVIVTLCQRKVNYGICWKKMEIICSKRISEKVLKPKRNFAKGTRKIKKEHNFKDGHRYHLKTQLQ